MASEAKPPILATPLEIRLEIYRHTWTVTFNCKEYSDNVLAGPPLCPEVVYFRLQVKPVHKLVSICQQMRNEVLSEYFHRTQVYLRSLIEGACWSIRQPYAMNYIQSSPLFASHTQHVSLHWSTDVFNVMASTLDWLLQLKQLKTLELLITHSFLCTTIRKADEEDLIPRLMNLTLDRYFGSSHFQRLTTLRNLEKIVVKLCFGPDWRSTSSKVHAGIWERTPRFQKIKETLSESVREDLRQPEQQPTYVFEQHIGAVWPGWPLSYRI